MGAAGNRRMSLRRRELPHHALCQLVHLRNICLLRLTLQFIQRSTTSMRVHRSSGVWRAAAAASWPLVSQQRMAMRAIVVVPP